MGSDATTPTVVPASPVPIEPGGIAGTSPAEAAAAPQKPDAVSGNAFDAFDRALGDKVAAAAAPAPAPPAPAPSAAPASPAFDPDKLPQDFRPRAEHWKIVNAERAKLREELAAVKKDMESLGDIATLKNLAAEKAELERQLRLVAAERDPAFQRQFEDGKKLFIADAVAAVPMEHAAEIESLLKRHGAAAAPYLRAFIQEHEIDAFSQSQLAHAVAGLRGLETNRERAVQEGVENWNKMVTEQRLAAQRQQEQQQRQLKALLDERLEVAQKENVLFHAATDEEKQGVAEAVTVANRVLAGELDAEERVNAALCVAAYPRLVKAYQALHAEHKKLSETAGKLRGVQPPGGTPSTGAAAPPEVPASGFGNEAGDIFTRRMREAGI